MYSSVSCHQGRSLRTSTFFIGLLLSNFTVVDLMASCIVKCIGILRRRKKPLPGLSRGWEEEALHREADERAARDGAALRAGLLRPLQMRVETLPD